VFKGLNSCPQLVFLWIMYKHIPAPVRLLRSPTYYFSWLLAQAFLAIPLHCGILSVHLSVW